MKSAKELLSTSKDHGEWIPLLEVSAKEVFELMLGTKLDTAEDITPNGLDIAAMVGLAGQLCGILTIRASKESASRMAFKMLGAETDKNSQEVYDAFGEICNMVAGNFKARVDGLREKCMLSVPTVITGQDYTLHSLSTDSGIEVAMLFQNLPVILRLEVHG